MTILLPTTCWMIGVSGWKLNHRVTLIGSFPVASLIQSHPAAVTNEPSPPLGPFATTAGTPGKLSPLPSPAGLVSVMKIHPLLDGGSCSEPTGLPPWGIGPLGHGLASTSVTAFAWIAAATSESVGQQCPVWKAVPGFWQLTSNASV